jgi:hypothetical protein
LVLVFTQAPEQLVSDPQPETQAPAMQFCPAAHAWPHAPECAVLACVSTHAPAQLVRPPSHPDTHAPARQTSPRPHALKQLPQWLAFVCVLVHTPPQVVCPAPHVTVVHALLTQDWPAEHARPHAPQLRSSTRGSTQEAPQVSSGLAQPPMHAPPRQDWPAAQAWPHMPQ